MEEIKEEIKKGIFQTVCDLYSNGPIRPNDLISCYQNSPHFQKLAEKSGRLAESYLATNALLDLIEEGKIQYSISKGIIPNISRC